ncbi:alpha/beta hydrolase [Rhodanobacter thiooxydans]|uniref:Alpha/beta hydrolase n=1 Tax=Rhodanobacter thiooxydans TaxID=416169 RepID=A0A154QGR0_9GAMM|nr:alpha/beta fold hydrolase [Rhodanobacter thiooxydans]EIM03069.1 putative alpha/beta hydrolase [Rhodanobacter thiooxydans LCS2]KZC22843.1 alpha/beta hydrolase [Rhodanobacter thiooxydans]MCW0200681.1 alpha/beta fold hydrolase [Rhodanobacter thiooxydans]
MADPSIDNIPATAEPLVLPATAADGARFELMAVCPAAAWQRLLYWIPAMGIPARHYLPLAQALAARGIAVVLHEWRGIGSSDRRAGRGSNWGYRQLLQDDLPAGLTTMRQRWPQASCLLGGHSLGGQLGLLYASLHPRDFTGLLLVASGSPYWRCFRHGGLIRQAYVLAPLLAGLLGYLPGRRLGFGGNEARGVIADWARSGRTGRYAASGMTQDFERQLAALPLPLLALRLQEDWLGPAASLEWLLGKLGPGARRVQTIARDDLGGQPADHFGWMGTPVPVAARIADWLAEPDAAFVASDSAAG